MTRTAAEASVIPTPPTRLLAVPGGDIEYLTIGSGEPRTVFAHGLAGGVADTRPLASGVPGSRTFLHFDGHGRSCVEPSSRIGYHELATHLGLVAAHVSARRAVGVSLGAAALLRLLADESATRAAQRFERAVLFLPAAFDEPSSPAAVGRHAALAERIAAADRDGVVAALLHTQPAGARTTPAALRWAEQRAVELIATARTSWWSRVVTETPVPDRAALAAVRTEVLVIAQQGDEVHPVRVAERLAAALPAAELRVFDDAGALWGHRRELRAVLSDFLGVWGRPQEA